MEKYLFYTGLWMIQQAAVNYNLLWFKILLNKDYYLKNGIINKENISRNYVHFFWYLGLIAPIAIFSYLYTLVLNVGLTFTMITILLSITIYLLPNNMIISFQEGTKMPVFKFKNRVYIIYDSVFNVFLGVVLLLLYSLLMVIN